MARGKVYNKIFNPEEWELVNKENKDIINDFIEEYRQRKKKPSTIEQYYNDLRIILIYIYKKLNNKSLFDLTKKDFRRISLWFTEDCGMSNSRHNRLMSAVRSLLTYCEDDDDYEYESNVARKVRGLEKDPIRVDEDDFFLTYEQIVALRDKLLSYDTLDKMVDAVLLMVSFDSGGRRNEICQIKKTGILDGNKTNIVTGKRGKTFPLVFLNDTKELIRKYLEKRGEDDIENLFIIGQGENKKPMSYSTIYDRIVSMSKLLSEIEGKNIAFFPHSLRHSRAECLLQGGDPRLIDKQTNLPRKFLLEEVQLILHHTDPKTTLQYAKDHSEEKIANMFNLE